MYLLPVASNGASLTAVTPLVFYKGLYPTAPLTDATNGPWMVQIRTFFSTSGSSSVTGSLSVSASWLTTPMIVPVSLPSGASNVSVTLPALSNVALWWPNGMGAQNLANVTIEFTATGAAQAQTLTRRIGFRTGYLVTADDSNPSSLAGVDGSGNFTFRWKVNGADLWARGGNIIPIDEMEGRFAAATYEKIVDAAADAGMNALRVWGGGIYPPDVFFERADERGLLIRHDAMFAGDGRIPPTGSLLEDTELRQQVRRIAAFPSLFSWDACNECSGGGVYADFVNTVMSEEDPSRPTWPSNPSNGWISGVDRLTGLPNGLPFVARLKSSNSITAQLPTVPLSLAVPHGGCLTSNNCTQQLNVDYAQGPVRTTVPVNTPIECCASCVSAGTNLCVFAVFYEGVCFYKLTIDASQPVWAGGRVAVWPAGSGPIPPAPAPSGNGIIEQHG